MPIDTQAAPAPSAAITPASNVTSVTLLLQNMSKVLAVDKAGYRMRVQAGMLVTQLLKEATAAGMSVPLGAVPAFGDLSLGGVLATGAHGTGLGATSSLVSAAGCWLTDASENGASSGPVGAALCANIMSVTCALPKPHPAATSLPS